MEWIHGLFHFFQQLGFIGITLGLMVEVIPSEIVLSYAGYLVYSGNLTFFSAMLAGILGGTVAQLFVYWIGLYGGRPFVQKFGKWILITPDHVQKSEKWFNQYGPTVVFFARFIPVVRHAISIPAGISKMPFSTFFLYTFAAMIPWTLLFVLLGINLGENWSEIEQHASTYIKPLIIFATVSLLVYFILKRRKR
ncbi:DedA family protein [Bacillus carboniphilus]|uniref:DedA family protein n=1 Tax=Bacillus carboniphilus TaxID=86663 RepID=A0ABP3FL56_9BACI